MTFHEEYLRLKAMHPDAIVLMQIGNYYEAFDEQASTLADVLGGLALPLKDGSHTLMAGFRLNSADRRIKKLTDAGHKVAVYDQVNRGALKPRVLNRIVGP